MGSSLLPSVTASSRIIAVTALCTFWIFSELVAAKHAGITRHYKFDIKLQNVTRLCRTKSIVTVNGQIPGPRIIAREGDRLLIKENGGKQTPRKSSARPCKQEEHRIFLMPTPLMVILDFCITVLPKAPNSTFLMAARPYATGPASFDNTTTAGVLEYDRNPSATNTKSKNKKLPLLKPSLPVFNDTTVATAFVKKIRSLANARFPAKVPRKVDRRFFFTIGLGLLPCSKNNTCQGPNNTMFSASVNNVSFVQPNIALLQSHFLNRSKGVYTTDFPTNPPFKFNYTGTPPSNIMTAKGTKVVAIPFNTSVELVFGSCTAIWKYTPAGA
ncbi:LACCASE-10 [Salix koriyanagi]|uniref:LACCASE-10 n=1 Tax=Salix koriyanagi TaxID=2511006 RepID=A0A9Q0ZU62_9ROSI|nr:LACCASE-10 [Salix koriyanagi]